MPHDTNTLALAALICLALNDPANEVYWADPKGWSMSEVAGPDGVKPNAFGFMHEDSEYAVEFHVERDAEDPTSIILSGVDDGDEVQTLKVGVEHAVADVMLFARTLVVEGRS